MAYTHNIIILIQYNGSFAFKVVTISNLANALKVKLLDTTETL